MFLRTHRRIYEVKYGLKGLIILRENLNTEMTEDLELLLYCGLIGQHPTITFQEVKEIIEECDLSSISQPRHLPSFFEIEELYRKAIGEIGITPSNFFIMTPEEIELAYEGYMRRKETEANLIKLAIISSNDGKLIRLTEDLGYSVGNENERNKVFKELNISEGFN